MLIDKYISNKQGLELVYYYIDDGYSGTNHIEVDNYLENIFPNYNISFISITENIDSFNNRDLMNNNEESS